MGNKWRFIQSYDNYIIDINGILLRIDETISRNMVKQLLQDQKSKDFLDLISNHSSTVMYETNKNGEIVVNLKKYNSLDNDKVILSRLLFILYNGPISSIERIKYIDGNKKNLNINNLDIETFFKYVIEIDDDNNVINKYNSILDTSKKLGISILSVSNFLKDVNKRMANNHHLATINADNKIERWKPIYKDSNYCVSDLGNIINRADGILLDRNIPFNKDGSVTYKAPNKEYIIADLVYRLFIDINFKPTTGKKISFADNDCTNLDYRNLLLVDYDSKSDYEKIINKPVKRINEFGRTVSVFETVKQASNVTKISYEEILESEQWVLL